MSAQDYAINFPYGATSDPYSVDHPHRGDDRPCPRLTPVLIGSDVIGLTGATGRVTGPHLHIQEWSGTYSNTRKPRNSFASGLVVNIDPAGTQGDGSFGKFITIRTEDGWNTTYCHLSQVNVQIGQKVGGSMSVTPDMNDGDVTNYWSWFLNKTPAKGDLDFWKKNPNHKEFNYDMRRRGDFKTRAQLDGEIAAAKTETLNQLKIVDIKQKEIDRLNAQLAIQSDDTNLLNSFGELLAKLIARLGVKKG